MRPKTHLQTEPETLRMILEYGKMKVIIWTLPTGDEPVEYVDISHLSTIKVINLL